jgi:hypothetical protein
LDNYYEIADSIINNFSRIVNKYVFRYDAGNIISSADIIIGKKALLEYKEPKLLTGGESQPNKKLKVKLSVPQLAYLFKLLYGFDLLDADTKDISHIFGRGHFFLIIFITKKTDSRIQVQFYIANFIQNGTYSQSK